MTREELSWRWVELWGGLRRALGRYAGNPRWEADGEIRVKRAEQGIEASEEEHYEEAKALNEPPARSRLMGGERPYETP